MSPQAGEQLTCQDLIEFLHEYLDGELPPAERLRFQAHIDCCPPCLHYLDSYEKTIRLAALACGPDDALPEDVPEELVRAILAARPRQA